MVREMDVIDATLQNPLIGIVDGDTSIRIFTRRPLMALGSWAEAFCSACEFLTANRMTDFACVIVDQRIRRTGSFNADCQSRTGRRV